MEAEIAGSKSKQVYLEVSPILFIGVCLQKSILRPCCFSPAQNHWKRFFKSPVRITNSYYNQTAIVIILLERLPAL